MYQKWCNKEKHGSNSFIRKERTSTRRPCRRINAHDYIHKKKIKRVQTNPTARQCTNQLTVLRFRSWTNYKLCARHPSPYDPRNCKRDRQLMDNKRWSQPFFKCVVSSTSTLLSVCVRQRARPCCLSPIGRPLARRWRARGYSYMGQRQLVWALTQTQIV